MAEDGDSHHPSKCTCLAAFGRPKPPQSEPKLPFPFVTSPWVLRDSAATARQAGGQIQAVIQGERESPCALETQPGASQRETSNQAKLSGTEIKGSWGGGGVGVWRSNKEQK